MPRVQLFLSTVSAEFLSYRERFRRLLMRPDVEVKLQEDFIVTGDKTLGPVVTPAGEPRRGAEGSLRMEFDKLVFPTGQALIDGLNVVKEPFNLSHVSQD